MWRHMFRTWLIGAAVTIAAPDCGRQSDAVTLPGDDTMASSGHAGNDRPQAAVRDRQAWRVGEPQLSSMLADPIIRLMMQSDRVTAGELAAVITSAKIALASRPVPQGDVG